MTNNRLRQSASLLNQKLQLLKFNNIVKLQLAKIMHSVHHYQARNSIMSNYVQTSARTEERQINYFFLWPKNMVWDIQWFKKSF